MPRAKTTAPDASKAPETPTVEPSRLMLGGLYVKQVDGQVFLGTPTSPRLQAATEHVQVEMAAEGCPNETFKVPLKDIVSDTVKLGDWEYAGGGCDVLEALNRVK